MSDESANLTLLVRSCESGSAEAREALFNAVHGDLKRIARGRAGVGRVGDTMQATALVNETVIELMRLLESPGRLEISSRREFFTVVALAMRGILKDHRRAKGALKRGAGRADARLPTVGVAGEVDASGTEGPFGRADLLDLDAAMSKLERHDERWYRVVLYRFYAGRSIRETGELMGLGETAVKADWRSARAWLIRELRAGRGGTQIRIGGSA